MTIRELEQMYRDITPENTGDFIWAVRSAYITKDITPLMLQGFLGRICDAFSYEGERICASGTAMTGDEEKSLIIHGKILAAYMLILTETRSYNEASRKMLQFLEYAACCTKGRNDLLVPAIKCLNNNCIEVLYTWENIRAAETLELLAYQAANTTRFSNEPLSPVTLQDKGHLSLAGGKLDVCSSYVGETGAKAWEICGGRVRVMTRNSRDEKLKASDVDDIARLDDFARVFHLAQSEGARAVSALHYQDVRAGRKCVIECTGLDPDEEYDTLMAAAVNTRERMSGHIIAEELIKGTFTSDLVDYIFENDCIDGAVAEINGETVEYSIRDCYARFAKETASKDYRESKVFEAVVLEVREDINRINWMTARGYGAISLPIEGLKAGDKAVMTVQNLQTRGSDLYINIMVPRDGYDTIDYLFDEENVLSAFIINKKTALERTAGAVPVSTDKDVSKAVFRRLARIMSRSNADVPPMERYKRLLTAGFICNCIGDADGYAYIQRECAYLSQLLRFARGLAVSLPSDLDSGDSRYGILECLTTFGDSSRMKVAASHISNGNADIVSQIASIIVSLAAADQFEDEVKVSSDDARMRICTLLGVQSSFSAGYTSRTGKYGQGESQMLEFKASYVMRNDGRGADLDYQGRGQVFEAVCAFLNTEEGGTVYVGVNDKTGDPIVSDEYGIKADMTWLCNNYGTVNSIRSRQIGHNIVKPDSVDRYALFLNGEKELFFKKSLHNNIIIEPTEDADAIRITVKPSLYEIAFLYKDNTFTQGTAYTRNGNRTVMMSKGAMEKRLMSLKQLSKEVQFIVTLNEAIDKKHKVILRGYHSGSSGQVRDRLVVPINLFYNDENVLCYDLEAKAERQFRLARITSIDTDVENPEYPHCFEAKTADVFRWIGNENYHIKLRMEVGALNYLIEEYSNTRNLPAEELYQDEDGKWILDTVLHGLGGVRRFYLGLADKITILPTEDSEKLKKDIRDFLSGNTGNI